MRELRQGTYALGFPKERETVHPGLASEVLAVEPLAADPAEPRGGEPFAEEERADGLVGATDTGRAAGSAADGPAVSGIGRRPE